MIEVQKLFNNQRVISEVLKSLPPLRTPVVDEIFTNKKLHPLPQIGVEYIKDITESLPLVKRTANGVTIGSETDSVMYIEPHPIRVIERISAKEANDLKSLGKDYQTFVAQKLDRMRRAIRLTTEALCSQALRGQIQYPIMTENGTLDTYIVDFTNSGENTPVSYTAQTPWANVNNISEILNDLINVSEKMQERGYGYNLKIWAGKNAFRKVVELAANLGAKSKIDVRIESRSVNVAGFEIELMNKVVRLPDGTTQKVVKDDEVLVIDKDAPFTLYYLAIDNFDAGLKASNVFVKAYKEPSGTSVVVMAESKPLPVPVLNAIAWMSV